MTRATPFALAGCLAALLAACNVGPDYRKPEIPVPEHYSERGSALPPNSKDDLASWWTSFHDDELDSLIARAIAANLDLQAAASRIRQAREQEIIAGAAEWPSLTANGLGVNVHSNSNPLSQLGGPSRGNEPAAATSTNIKLYSLGFDATWELDIFGGTRRAVEAAQTNSEAALWELHDGEVTLTAEVANDYLALRAAQARLTLLESELADQRRLLDLVRARAKNGFVTELDVNQQRTLVSTTEAQLPDLDAQSRALMHALAVLLAQPPETTDIQLKERRPMPSPPSVIPASLPSELLRRRPDIREAERKLAAATANEGVAVADLYPKFNLIGAASFTGSALSGLVSSDNFGTVGIASIMWPIFEGGKIRAGIRSSEEAELQAYLAYRKSVLGALQNVEDSLARCADDGRHIRSLEAAENAASSSAEIAQQQFANGIVNFINVLTAEMALLSARDALVQAQQALSQDLAGLYKALGGGWNEASIDWKTRPPDPENN